MPTRSASTTTFEAHRVIDFLAFDRENPSSILNCLRSARENAHAVRGSISSEMWETFNATWLEARANAPTRFTARNVAEFVEWVKYRAHLARGVVLGSMLRDEGYHFMQIGTFLERTDGVARLLQVRLACEATDWCWRTRHARLPALGRAVARVVGVRDFPARIARPRNAAARLRIRRFPPDVPRSLLRSAALVYENLQRRARTTQSGGDRAPRTAIVCTATARAFRHASITRRYAARHCDRRFLARRARRASADHQLTASDRGLPRRTYAPA